MNVNLKQRFQEILEDNRILEAELMSRHTTFRIGGPADFFLVPENADEIKKIIEYWNSAGQKISRILFLEMEAIFL